MKQKTSLLSLLALSLLIGFSSCKKDKETTGNNVDISTHSDDQTLFSSELDLATNDADVSLDAYATYYSPRGLDIPIDICDAEVDFDAESTPKKITITYDGENCSGNRTRTGSIVITFDSNTFWGQEDAEVSISFNNFKVTRARDNKSVTINGALTYTNITGGYLKNLSSQSTIVHTVEGDLSVTFDNTAARTWSVAKEKTFTYNNGIVASVKGLHTAGNENNIAEWGTNRLGLAFATSTVEPIVVRQDCDFRVTGGVIKHTVGGATATGTFGLNAQGNPVSCPEGSYYVKVIYLGPGGNSITLILPY